MCNFFTQEGKNLHAVTTSCYIESMKKLHIATLLATLTGGLCLVNCERDEKSKEPQTAQEMYEYVHTLLQPNVKRDSSDFGEALKWLRRAAEAGHLQAQTDLGGLYLEGGKGVKQDGKEALKYGSKPGK